MKEKQLAELSDVEILARRKEMKSTEIISTVFFGVIIGIAVYSTVKNGFGLLTFIPLLYAPIAASHSKNKKAVETEIKRRGL